MIPALVNNPLFRGITPERLSADLEEISFHTRSYKKGEILAQQGAVCNRLVILMTINASNDYKITDYLKVGFQFNGARMLPADSKQVLNALRATPIAPVYNDEYGLYSALPEFQKAQINNPMVDVSLRANTTKAENYRASGNIYGEVKVPRKR